MECQFLGDAHKIVVFVVASREMSMNTFRNDITAQHNGVEGEQNKSIRRIGTCERCPERDCNRILPEGANQN